MSDAVPVETGNDENGNELVAMDTKDYVSMTICGQLFGIPVLTVQDVLSEQSITRIPLAPKEVAGALNLRGRIVTAIDIRTRLGLPPRKRGEKRMNVVVEYKGELYSFIIDVVGEVLSLPSSSYERSPATLDPNWRDVSAGVYRLENELLVVFDVTRLLEFGEQEAA
ncbi:MAG: chemotaxis protein CheW [Alphaproteobacteria bacterium]|nr:chemotaxis protein CheW [Alphaproteobacteria bacterium]